VGKQAYALLLMPPSHCQPWEQVSHAGMGRMYWVWQTAFLRNAVFEKQWYAGTSQDFIIKLSTGRGKK
jgi:hypothetical protein